LSKKCVPGNTNNPGTFTTKQECIESGCEPLPADVGKDMEAGDFGPAGPVAPPSGQSKITQPGEKGGEEIDQSLRERFQKLANISKK
jgi:hypothetical protein